MKNYLLTMAAILTIPMVACGNEPPIVTEQPAVIVWYENWGLGAKTIEPQILVAIWTNGRVMWSTNTVYGGAPYFEAKVDPAKSLEFLNSCRNRGYFGAKYIRNYFGPDSWFTGIYLTSGTNSFVTRSWHEVAEMNPKTVAASYGLRRLGGQNRDDFLKKDTPEYQEYRAMWTDVRKMIGDLLPCQGDVVHNIKFSRDKERQIPIIGQTIPLSRSGPPAGQPLRLVPKVPK